MKHALGALLFCLISSIANAQDETITLSVPIKCAKVEQVLSYFATQYEEKPIWVGKTLRNTHVTLLVNRERRSWTLVEYDAAMACILGAGDTSSDPNI